MGNNIMAWVNEWFIDNALPDVSDITDAFVSEEVCRFTLDANNQGISQRQLEEVLGNLHIYMADEYERVINEAKHECAGRGD